MALDDVIGNWKCDLYFYQAETEVSTKGDEVEEEEEEEEENQEEEAEKLKPSEDIGGVLNAIEQEDVVNVFVKEAHEKSASQRQQTADADDELEYPDACLPAEWYSNMILNQV